MDKNKYLFVFRSWNQDVICFIGIVVTGHDVDKAVEIAKTECWFVNSHDVVYGVLVDTNIKIGMAFCERVYTADE